MDQPLPVWHPIDGGTGFSWQLCCLSGIVSCVGVQLLARVNCKLCSTKPIPKQFGRAADIVSETHRYFVTRWLVYLFWAKTTTKRCASILGSLEVWEQTGWQSAFESWLLGGSLICRYDLLISLRLSADAIPPGPPAGAEIQGLRSKCWLLQKRYSLCFFWGVGSVSYAGLEYRLVDAEPNPSLLSIRALLCFFPFASWSHG